MLHCVSLIVLLLAFEPLDAGAGLHMYTYTAGTYAAEHELNKVVLFQIMPTKEATHLCPVWYILQPPTEPSFV